ncbi:MAG TPA: tRNA guanosine(34) transglycosylase Tgt [Ktedonobacterales bacterium]
MSLAKDQLPLPHGTLRFPVFLPDATNGAVRAVDATDLAACGIQAVQTNAFHLMQRPGSSVVEALGGLHAMLGWQGPIITDSGGFQVYSLIRQNPKQGSMSNQGIIFRPEGSERKISLTPEKSVQLQMSYGTDVVICLDDCTHVDDPLAAQEASVARTIAWAKRCKEEYERRLEQQQLSGEKRPALFAVIQGGGHLNLRKRCAEALLEIGFDGYGFGGWPLDAQGNLLTDILHYTRELVPSQFPMHALGVGHPANIVTCYRLGYPIFDSVMPTRDARHGRLYLLRGGLAAQLTEAASEWFSYLYIADEKHVKSAAPVSEWCDCLCCAHYSQGYLHHLFKMSDSLYFRLATIHNLRCMAQLTECLRDERLRAEAPETP